MIITVHLFGLSQHFWLPLGKGFVLQRQGACSACFSLTNTFTHFVQEFIQKKKKKKILQVWR